MENNRYFDESVINNVKKVVGSKEEKKSLAELELEYDKKFNGFCLQASSMSADKLKDVLENKEEQLNAAKIELKNASKDRKNEARIKIDYLENICNKCKALIKKKGIAESVESLEESSTLHKILLNRYMKPRMNLEQILKAHKYPGYINMIEHLKDMDDVKYIRQDMSIGEKQFKTIQERIDKCKDGETDQNKNYYKGIKKLYIDKGITSKDVQLTRDWYNTVARDALNKKAKELKEKESKKK